MGRVIVVIFGLMGTGKTTLARALGASRRWPVVSSDAVRKTLAGEAPTTRLPLKFGEGIYAPDFSARTYAEMRRLARQHLAAAPAVILEASFKREAERAQVRDLARELGAAAVFIYCHCSLEVVRERLAWRVTDPQAISNGREELLAAQAADFDPPTAADQPLLRLATAREVEGLLEEINTFISQGMEPKRGRDAT